MGGAAFEGRRFVAFFSPQKKRKFYSYYQSKENPAGILTVKAVCFLLPQSCPDDSSHVISRILFPPILSYPAVPVMYIIAVKCLCEYVLFLEHYAKVVTYCIRCGGPVSALF